MIKKFFKSKIFSHFFQNPLAVVGLSILLTIVIVSICAPWIATQNPYDAANLDLSKNFMPPVWTQNGELPYIFGTDGQGRDILSAIIYGARVSLIVGFSVVLLAGTIGATLGLISGFLGGLIDTLIMRVADTFFSFPSMLLALLIMGILGERGTHIVIFSLTLIEWVRYARTMHGNVLLKKEMAYTEAAKSIGAGNLRIMFKHILPNALSPLLVIGTVSLGKVIMLESTLSFLGVGVPVTRPSLGMLIANGREYIYSGRWWLIVFPGAYLLIIIMGVNLFGDWLRDELNPKRTTVNL